MSSRLLKRKAHSVNAMRELARRRLPRLVFDFVDGGAEDERALRRNEEAFGEARLLPRPLTGTAARDQTFSLDSVGNWSSLVTKVNGTPTRKMG